MTGDSRKALAFLKRFHVDNKYTLTAIPNDGGNLDSKSFFGASDEEILSWLDEHQGKSNIYFLVNETDVKINNKAKKSDIYKMNYLHVDIDPDIKRSKEDILKELNGFEPKPSCILDSGGGYQAFWKLKEPIIIGRQKKIHECEAYNRQIAINLNADKCHNIDRIMRVPHTVNIPNKVKRDKGRTECISDILEFSDIKYDIDDFIPAPPTGSFGDVHQVEIGGNLPPVDVDDLKIDDRTKAMIFHGEDPADEDRYDSRSECSFAVVCSLLRQNFDHDVIASICLNPEHKISGHFLDQRRPTEYMARQIMRAKTFNDKPELLDMNDKYCVVNEGGGTTVFYETYNPDIDRKEIQRMSFTDFRNLYCNQLVQDGTDAKGNPKYIQLGTWWLNHHSRRTYPKGVIYSPHLEMPGYYNTWTGFMFEAKEGKWDKFKNHIKENVCSGVEEYYEYLLNWMARAVQKPALQGEVAIVLRGEKGVGKGFFVNNFGKLFGQHYMPVTNAIHLTGRFNAHLSDVSVVFADEAFWAGDKQGESSLKTLITEKLMVVERKYSQSSVASNHISLIVASNSDWVVPASGKERRFFVLDVKENNIQDTDFFGNIEEELLSGGYSAMLYELLKRDIKGFNFRTIPTTEALTEQKIFSLQGSEKWWYKCLTEGHIHEEQQDWETSITSDEIYEDYVDTLQKTNSRQQRSIKTEIGIFLQKYAPGHTKKKTYVANGSSGKHKTIYTMPELDSCRDVFQKSIGAEIDWPEIDYVVTEQEVF